MPYGKLLTWEEFIGSEPLELELRAPVSCVEDIRDHIPTQDIVVVTHKLESGLSNVVHGSLVVEGGEEQKKKLLEVHAGKKVKVTINPKEDSKQSFLNIVVVDVSDIEAPKDVKEDGINTEGNAT